MDVVSDFIEFKHFCSFKPFKYKNLYKITFCLSSSKLKFKTYTSLPYKRVELALCCLLKYTLKKCKYMYHNFTSLGATKFERKRDELFPNALEHKKKESFKDF